MSCGGRVYKGDTILVSIPFDVSGYTDLVVSYFTVGDTKIVRDESGLTIEDGYITSYFEGHDLDLLPDGVLRFTLQYKVDDVDYVDSSNTMLYLKTPASYSAVTEEVIYEEGFSSGYTKGVGECEEIAEEAYDNGYASGHTDGVAEGYSDGFHAGVSDTRSRMVSTAITANGVYERGDGFNRVEVDVPLDTPCNIDEGKIVDMGNYFPYYSTTVVPSSGYAGLESVTVNASSVYSQGVNDVANQFVTLSATTNGTYLPQSTYAVFKEVYVNVDTDCSSAITEAYQSGFTEGIEAQKSRMESITITANTAVTRTDGWNQITVNVPQSSGGSCTLQSKSYVLGVNFTGASGPITPDLGYDGFSSFEVSDEGYGQGKFEEGRLLGEYYGYESGHNDGMIEGFQSGYTVGYRGGYSSGYTDGEAHSLYTEITFTNEQDITFGSGAYAFWIGTDYQYVTELDGDIMVIWDNKTLSAGTHTVKTNSSFITDNTELRFQGNYVGYNDGGSFTQTAVTNVVMKLKKTITQ